MEVYNQRDPTITMLCFVSLNPLLNFLLDLHLTNRRFTLCSQHAREGHLYSPVKKKVHVAADAGERFNALVVRQEVAMLLA